MTLLCCARHTTNSQSSCWRPLRSAWGWRGQPPADIHLDSVHLNSTSTPTDYPLAHHTLRTLLTHEYATPTSGRSLAGSSCWMGDPSAHACRDPPPGACTPLHSAAPGTQTHVQPPVVCCRPRARARPYDPPTDHPSVVDMCAHNAAPILDTLLRQVGLTVNTTKSKVRICTPQSHSFSSRVFGSAAWPVNLLRTTHRTATPCFIPRRPLLPAPCSR